MKVPVTVDDLRLRKALRNMEMEAALRYVGLVE